MVMYKHWLAFFDAQGRQMGLHKTDCRLEIRHMVEHANALAEAKFRPAKEFQILREDGRGKANLVDVTERHPCR